MKPGVTVTGKVWSLGAKRGYDPVHGQYLRFVVKVGTTTKHAKTKIWVDWYDAGVWPEPGAWVTCTGFLGMARLDVTAGGDNRGEVYIECHGADGAIESSPLGRGRPKKVASGT